MIEIHYFASVREALQRSEDELHLADDIITVGDLVNVLCKQDQAFKSMNDAGNPLLIAVNQTVVDKTYKLSSDDEVAFFPPMTGG